jgi:hypothetical protein
MQHCSVCGHASIRDINTALKSKVADREVERRFPGVTRASISRHRRNHMDVGADDPDADPGLTPEVLPPLRSQKAKSTNTGGKIDIEHRKAIDQQRAVCGATWKLIDKALKKGNLGVATTNLRNMTEAIKALAALTGELEPATTQVFNFQMCDGFRRAAELRRAQAIDVQPAVEGNTP